MYQVSDVCGRLRRGHTHTYRVCCNVSEKEYSSLLEVSPLTKYFYDVKRMLIRIRVCYGDYRLHCRE